MPVERLRRRDVLAGVGAALLVGACKSAKSDATASQAVRPEDPVDEAFRGCQLSTSCGASTAPEGVTPVLQPGAKTGDYTRCPVSGAVFMVDDKRQRREVGGRAVFFCCAACARYFDEHADAVTALRRLS
jgi:hypothetical protein